MEPQHTRLSSVRMAHVLVTPNTNATAFSLLENAKLLGGISPLLSPMLFVWPYPSCPPSFLPQQIDSPLSNTAQTCDATGER